HALFPLSFEPFRSSAGPPCAWRIPGRVLLVDIGKRDGRQLFEERMIGQGAGSESRALGLAGLLVAARPINRRREEAILAGADHLDSLRRPLDKSHQTVRGMGECGVRSSEFGVGP